MDNLYDIINVIREESNKVRDLLLRKKDVIEGMGCSDGYINSGDECIKEVKTINIFLTTPIANTIVLAMASFIFSSMLYKFKSTPLAVNKTGTACKEVPLDRIFRENILDGVVHEDIYSGKTLKHRTDFEKFQKIVFPSLTKNWYPAKIEKEPVVDSDGNPGPDMVPLKYILMIPLYITLKFSTKLYYKTFASIKAALYKHKQWGGIQEIDKINKSSWLKDLFMIIFIIPALLFFVIPIIFLVQIVWGFLIAPGWTFMQYCKNEDDQMRYTDPNQNPIISGILTFFKCVGVFIALAFGGVAFSFIIFLLTIGWFFSTVSGFSERKRGGPQIIFKTWGNIIWDYKYIWAFLAISIWTLNLEAYLKGPHNLLTFINDSNKDIVIGLIGGISAIMLLKKQATFFKFLPKTPKSRSECYPNCNPPVDINDPSQKEEKCKKNKESV